MGLLITPSGVRIPYSKSFHTRAYCEQKKRPYGKQTELAAEVVERYDLRGQIELFFKELKSTLGLHPYRLPGSSGSRMGWNLCWCRSCSWSGIGSSN